MASRTHPLPLAAGVALALWIAPAAIARPALTVPATSTQGATATLTIDARRAHGCRLTARGPTSRRQSKRIPGSHTYTVHLAIARRAAIGTWTLRVRCREGWSAALPLSISGDPAASGRALF